MTELADYRDRYEHVAFDRTDDGVLEMRVHTEGGPLRWGLGPHDDLYRAFRDVADDRENRVVIFTGTGEEFSGPICDIEEHRHFTPRKWDSAFYIGKQLQVNMLNIEVPMIAAINGPCHRHSELPLLCDIVLASTDTVFADTGHFERGGIVPGDGIATVMQMIVGINRSRYYHLMDQFIDADAALQLGMVSEVLPADKLLGRAREIAHHLAAKPILHLRYTRRVLVEPIREAINRWVPFGLAIEGLAMVDPDGQGSETVVGGQA